MQQTKICDANRNGCGKELPIEDFHFADKKNGIRKAICKKCRKARNIMLVTEFNSIDKKANTGVTLKRLRSSWRDMMNRCYDHTDYSYKYYGGKGVTVCEKWHKFTTFKGWALANGYDDSLYLDKDIKGNSKIYDENACSFVTRVTNNREAHNKPVIMYIANKEVRRFSSITECTSITGLNQDSVSRNCKSKSTKIRGYNFTLRFA